ncbi:hypothetical protein CRG98_003537 [Punica granatum]|uniref:Retroviral polymerase SH3-like domain-containing protein n=1 Tax=Punica granatum TaxID=22663 RepID=A0A2I0L5S7_PUNGR|nr:hypothetical protein CRG98_003537 [Punica granatum]
MKCIFVVYNNERNGWRCCDPTTNTIYVSRNVVFNEASARWVPKHVILPERKAREDSIEEKTGEQPKDKEVEDVGAPVQSPKKKANPWKTGVYRRSEEQEISREEEMEEESQPELRRSSRLRRPNPKYVNVALVQASDHPPIQHQRKELVLRDSVGNQH